MKVCYQKIPYICTVYQASQNIFPHINLMWCGTSIQSWGNASGCNNKGEPTHLGHLSLRRPPWLLEFNRFSILVNGRLTYRIPLGIRHLAWHIINKDFFKSTCDPLYISFGLTKNSFFKKSVTFFHSFIMINGPLYISSWYPLFNNYQQ